MRRFRIPFVLSILLAALLALPARADWTTKGQGFLRTTATTTAAQLAGTANDGWLEVRQIVVNASDATGGTPPYTVTIKRDGAEFENWLLYPGDVYVLSYGGDGKRMYNLEVSAIEQPGAGSVTVKVEYGK